MKKFFKKNLWLFILLFIGIALALLSAISFYFLLVACIIFGVISLTFAIKLRKKYKTIEEMPDDVNIFDARELDYDEDIYYFDVESKNKKIGKSFLSKISLNAPSIGLFLLGFGFFSISIVSLIKFFF